MATRKYSFEKMTDEQLDTLAAKFPKAVEVVTVRKPVYSVIAKLLDCGVDVPGVTLVAQEEEKPAFLHNVAKA